MHFLSAKIGIVRDSYKFIALFLATLALVAALVFFGHWKELQAGAGARVDVKRIEKLVQEGRLVVRPAEFGRKVKSPEEEGSE